LGELNKTIAELVERLNTRPFKKIEATAVFAFSEALRALT